MDTRNNLIERGSSTNDASSQKITSLKTNTPGYRIRSVYTSDLGSEEYLERKDPSN